MSICNEVLPRTTLILAGGQGTRMGGEKLALAVDSELLLSKVVRRIVSFSDEILLSVTPGQVPYVSSVLSGIISRYGIRVVQDSIPMRAGPLLGIVSGLEASSSDWLFVCACDMPAISEAVVRTLWKSGDKSASVIVPYIGGFYQPLHAFYNRSCLPEAGRLLREGRRKTTALYDMVPVSLVEDGNFSHLPGYKRSFENINSMDDLERVAGPLR
ncbi:MAG: molybdenum cofactor guanylyltransferase [Synergistaceae bacterium]|nr:molybdenum cofactor guanylyltransferase [Synergistota bacterium]NLM70877.1 molybdenum cofactor guanylyltransferase [Synergistaceae bacterium]